MTDAEFESFLTCCRGELDQKQVAFDLRLVYGKPWLYDLAYCKLSINDGAEVLSFTPIGTYSKKYGSWLWAWANEDFPSYARDKARRLDGLFEVTQFEVFRTAGFPANSDRVNDLLALSVHQLEGIGFFRVPSQDPEMPSLFLSIDTPLIEPD